MRSGLRGGMSYVFRVGALLGAVSLAACGGDDPGPEKEPLVRADAGTPKPPPGMLDCTTSLDSEDADLDGFSPDQGDCNDCDPLIGPGSMEVIGNDIDEDCDGVALEVEEACDLKLAENSQDPDDAAHALGLCNFAKAPSNRRWGVRNVRYMRMDGDRGLGNRLQVGLSESFGTIQAREGGRMLVLSTGVARDALHDDYTWGCDTFDSEPVAQNEWSGGHEPPALYPVDSSRCPAGTSSKGALAYNDVELELTLRVPLNAKSLSFESMFFTYEYPDFVCSVFNDFFIVQMGIGTTPRSAKENILFDSRDGLVGVNTALLSVCRESERSALEQECRQGPGLLKYTGFDRGESTCGVHPEKEDIGGASTGWLQTRVPVVAGKSIILRFRLWDSGDPNLDSTVLLDNFRFSADEVDGPYTGPIQGGI